MPGKVGASIMDQTESILRLLLAIVLVLFGVCLFALFCHRFRYERIRKTAYSDSVTGGLNEAGFLLRSGKILKKEYLSYAVVCIRIPELSQISKIFGLSDYGRLLCFLRKVLSSQLGGDELLARTGNHSFAFLLRNRKPEEIAAKLENISVAFNRFNEGKVNTYHLYPIYGVYLPDSEREPPKQMLDKAKFALMHVPDGKNYSFYDQEHVEKIERERMLAKSIPQALQNGEFVVYYQPKVRVSDQRVVGAEALIRWRTARDGILSPDMFLASAERYNMMEQIDSFVFGEVCRTLSRWQKEGRELCTISVNLSRSSICRQGLPDEYYDICSKYEVSPALIEFDLCEEHLLEDMTHAKSLIERLHYYGFRCAVDKFGSDMCSLQMLGSLEIDSLNLDRSFFSGDNNNRHGRYMVENLLRLAAQLHIRTASIGIDNYGQVKYLRQAACDVIQGFYFFKPMPLEKLEAEIYDGVSLRYIDTSANETEASYGRKLSPVQNPLQPSKSIVLFSYNLQEDTIEFSESFSPVLENQKTFRNALALFRTTDLIHENDRKDFFPLLERCQREEGWVESTLRFYMLGGRYEWLELRMHYDEQPSGGIISGAFADMSGWKNEINRWKEKATRDPLTGLYNREHFEQSVMTILNQKKHASAALLFVDVDYFKTVNDTFGHMFGDDVLCFVAKQILSIFRHSDIIARYGGDEFVVFAPSIERSVLETRLAKLWNTFQYPYRDGTNETNITVTIGCSMFPQDGTDYDAMLSHADCALYEAKERGRNQYVFYEPYMKGNPDNT